MEAQYNILESSILPVYEGRTINGKLEHEQLVSARELWEKLEVGRDFTNWIKDRIEKYSFNEGEDFSLNWAKSTGGRPATEYMLTLDTAKEIAMVENNDIGRQLRRYFIEVDKRYRELSKIRVQAKTERRVLTDIIKELVPESPHKSWVYKHYTDLVYKIVTGYNAKEFREIHNLKADANIRSKLNDDELKKVIRLERAIQGLLSLGMGYEEIKNLITNMASDKGAFLMSKNKEIDNG